MLSTSISAILAIVQALVPILGTSSATASVIASIIDALTKLMPFIIDEISTVYQSVKNIIAALQNSGAPDQAQLDALNTLDAQVDKAWNDVQAQIDPDNPANAGTPAGDDPAA